MTSSERPTLLRQTVVATFWVLLGAVVTGVAMRYVFLVADEGDRPPIIVSNGSVRVQEADHRRVGSRPGKFVKSGTANGKTTWRHEHTGPSTKRMEVLVSGVNPGNSTACGLQSDFYARSVDSIQITYTLPDSAATRTLDVNLVSSHIEVAVSEAAVAAQTSGQEYVVDFDGAGVKLQTATLALAKESAACTFGATSGDGTPIPPRIIILQRQK